MAGKKEELIENYGQKRNESATLEPEEELIENYGQKRNESATLEPEESSEETDDKEEEEEDVDDDDDDDDDDVLTVEELKKTEGYKLTMRGLAIMRAEEARDNERDQ